MRGVVLPSYKPSLRAQGELYLPHPIFAEISNIFLKLAAMSYEKYQLYVSYFYRSPDWDLLVTQIQVEPG